MPVMWWRWHPGVLPISDSRRSAICAAAGPIIYVAIPVATALFMTALEIRPPFISARIFAMPILLKARLSQLTSEASIAVIAAMLATTALWLGVLLVLRKCGCISASASASLARSVLDLAGPVARSKRRFQRRSGGLSGWLWWRRSSQLKLIPAYSV